VSIFPSGPAHTNGTRQLAPSSGPAIRGYHQHPKDLGDPPDFAGAGAPCTRPEVDEDLWHPNGYEKAYRLQAAKAIALCNTCPMRIECLAWAEAIGATHGIWGGVWIDYKAGSRNRKQKRSA
jgi:WhiB family redox-sensing transcriptional regulator